MRATKAKALRRLMGFKPSAPREYSFDRTIEKYARQGLRIKRYSIGVGTATNTGARRQYQAVKRRRMAGIVLGAK